MTEATMWFIQQSDPSLLNYYYPLSQGEERWVNSMSSDKL